MTLLVLVGMGLVQAVHWMLSVRLKRLSRDLTANNSRMASGMLQLVHSGRLVRLFQREKTEVAEFAGISDQVRRAALSLNRRQAALPAVTEVLHALLFLVTVFVGWNTGLEFPVIASFMVLLYRMQPHFREVQMNWTHLHGWSGSLEEVEWLLDEHGKPAPPGGTAPFGGLRDRIEFRDVSFSYPGTGGRRSLHSLDFVIRKGQATALIGRSGSGKSTIVNLLCRFLGPEEGKILIDGFDLEGISPVSWRSHIAVASQDLELAHGTIAENIAYGRAGARRSEVERAARMAEAHGFIAELPEGYDTDIGYRGTFLSEGQRQRIALARALVLKPDILILDEATNSLDGLSEAAIVETLETRKGNGTTIVISHQESAIRFCDDVVTLENGRVISRTKSSGALPPRGNQRLRR
jgi:ABC-type multidrug transport system fused ATPase/permease subunit